MIIDSDFLDHWRTRMLVDLLDDEMAPLYVMRLWGHCQNRKQTQLKPMPNPGLKAVCRYPGDADKFADSMVQAGFIERDGDDGFAVPKFREKNAQLFASYENGKKGGRPKKNPAETQPKPKPNPEETRVDKSREEKKGLASANPNAAENAAIVAAIEPPELREVVAGWVEYKRDKRQAYKPKGLRSLVTQAEKAFSTHGLDALRDGVESAMANGYTGIVWEKIGAASRGSPASSNAAKGAAYLARRKGETIGNP